METVLIFVPKIYYWFCF